MAIAERFEEKRKEGLPIGIRLVSPIFDDQLVSATLAVMKENYQHRNADYSATAIGAQRTVDISANVGQVSSYHGDHQTVSPREDPVKTNIAANFVAATEDLVHKDKKSGVVPTRKS